MNPSFEDTIPCNQVNYPPSFSCYPWFWATGGSVDYFSETNQCWAYSAPKAFSVFSMQEQAWHIVVWVFGVGPS